MEDLWKDITLSTLTSSSSSPLHNNPSSSPTTIFQDFLTLARPFSSSSSKTSVLKSAASSASNSPQTATTLKTPHDNINPPNYNPFENKTSFSSGSKHSYDRRHKRMIKNRESAARSRARKQAYTNELELEVAHLKLENAKLRLEQQMRNQAELNRHSPKKHKLHRTSTAPF